MANNIKGITIEIGGDATKLEQALQSAEDTSKSLKNQLSEVNYQLRFDPGNTTLLTQKQELLTKEISNTSAKLATLKEAEKQAQAQFEKGEISQEQYQALQREVIKTESQLKSLTKQAEKFGSVLTQQLEQAGKKLTETGSKISGVGKSLLPVTAVATGLGAAALKYASDEQEALNKTQASFKDAASEVVAFSETSLESYGIAKGTALDMASLFGDMGTSMGQTTGEASKMSTSLVGLAGDLASFKNIDLDQAQNALKGIFTGETESLKSLGIIMTQTNLDAYALANGFGKTTTKMTESEKVTLRYQYVMNSTKNAQGDFAKNAGDSLAVNLTVVKESAKELAASFGTQLIPAIVPLIQKATALIQKLGGLDEGTKRMIIGVATVAAVVGPALIVTGKIVGAVGQILPLFGKIGSLLSGANKIIPLFGKVKTAISGLVGSTGLLSKAFSFLAANPIVLIIAAVAALVIGLIYLWNTNEDFRNGVTKIWNGIKNVVSTVVDAIVEFFTVTIPNVWNKFIAFMGEWGPLILTLVSPILGVPLLIIQHWDEIRVFLKKLWEKIVKFFKELPDKVKTFLTGIRDKIKAWAEGVIEGAKTKAEEFVAAVVTFVEELPDKMLEIGENIVKGIWDGIKNAVEWLHDKITEFCNGIVDDFKSLLQINSPSKLFADVVGKNLALGIGNGFTENMKAVAGKMASAIPTTWDTGITLRAAMAGSYGVSAQSLSTASGSATSGSNGTAAMVGGNTYNMNVQSRDMQNVAQLAATFERMHQRERAK